MGEHQFFSVKHFLVFYCVLFLKLYEDMVHHLMMLTVLFTQDSEVEDLFCGASPGSELSLFFSNKCLQLGV